MARVQPNEATTRSEDMMRGPDDVMSLARLGAMHSTRISFARTLVRRMMRERWRFTRECFEMDDDGYGTAVYSVDTGAASLSFVAFTDALDPAMRTDRVIATRWDAAFVLVEGVVDEARIDRLRRHVPCQEAGRLSSDELILSRANRSVRVFEHVRDRLARGRQPDMEMVREVGYLMRTTAVYGNGKFGLADLAHIQGEGVFRLPYQAEMLTVYLARELSADLVEHVAARRNPERAVRLEPRIRRALGVGNATGLGMAPFLIRHPQLVNRWWSARERALASVKALPAASPADCRRFQCLLARARRHVGQWSTADTRQNARIEALARELGALGRDVDGVVARVLTQHRPWAALAAWIGREFTLETQELINSLLMELFPERVDSFENDTGVSECLRVQPAMRVKDLLALIERDYAFALGMDFSDPRESARFWYMSQEKAEPRLGQRGVDSGDEREMRLDIARQVNALHARLSTLSTASRRASVASFLLREPGLRGIVARVQSLAGLPYAEVHGNVIGEQCLAIDLLRAKLAMFGAAKFDPKSDRWTRITLFQGAPGVSELASEDADDWWMPVLPDDTP